MKWIKHGLIFNAPGKFSWAESFALQPTPIALDNERIRVYVGARDNDGVSRIGYVDLDAEDPQKILSCSRCPVLDIGADGAFDEFGVVPCAVLERDGEIILYYAGYQRGHKVRFLVLGGMAVSTDGGETFVRIRNTPVFERTSDEFLFRVPHTVMLDDGRYKIWYGGGSKFVTGKNKSLPVYDIRFLESKDGVDIPNSGQVCISTDRGEYRLGRPYVIKRPDGGYRMFYGYSTEQNHYKLGFADSADGVSWTRRDDELGLPLEGSGWDSEMMAYPSVFSVRQKTYMLYNGNNYGESGFGLAELIEW